MGKNDLSAFVGVHLRLNQFFSSASGEIAKLIARWRRSQWLSYFTGVILTHTSVNPYFCPSGIACGLSDRE